MKIAQITPVLETVPPKFYGGIERIVTELSLNLAKQNHRVTVYAAGGSRLNETNVFTKACSPYPTRLHLDENRKWEIRQLIKVVAEQDRYDLLHFHYEPLITEIPFTNVNFFDLLSKPFVCTFHNTTHLSKNVQAYRSQKRFFRYPCVSISDDQRQPLDFMNFVATVYNGIPIKKFPFQNKPKDYLMFLGRATAVKGIEESIKIAKLAKQKLYIAAKVDPVDHNFFQKKIKPFLNGRDIIWLGEIPHHKKVWYLKNARALLFPIKWAEPFGLVVVEAMACGTPVIATDIGSMGEIIKDGKTGSLVRPKEVIRESLQKLRKINTLNRLHIRQEVEKRFTSEIMTKNYLKVYQKILSG